MSSDKPTFCIEGNKPEWISPPLLVVPEACQANCMPLRKTVTNRANRTALANPGLQATIACPGTENGRSTNRCQAKEIVLVPEECDPSSDKPPTKWTIDEEKSFPLEVWARYPESHVEFFVRCLEAAGPTTDA